MSMYESDLASKHAMESSQSDEQVEPQDYGSNELQRQMIARNQRALGGGSAANPLWGAVNDSALEFQRGDKVEIESEFGVARAHTGRGGQPMITTRAAEFDGESVGDSYPALITALKKSKLDDKVIAQALLDEDAAVLPAGKPRNAAAKLMAITQFAEESRNPSSGKYFRAALRYVAAKGGLRDVILEGYIPARDGGTGAMREFLQQIGEPDLAEELASDMSGYVSADSDDEKMQ